MNEGARVERRRDVLGADDAARRATSATPDRTSDNPTGTIDLYKNRRPRVSRLPERVCCS